jgi:O-antigen ligase
MKNATLFLNDKKWAEFSALERLALLCVLLTPVFFLSVRHWISNVSVLAALLSMAAIYVRRADIRPRHIPGIGMVALCFSVYTLGIVLSQMGRQTWVTREYLDQTRWLIGLPCFVMLSACRVNYVYVLERVLPVSLMAAWLGLHYFPSDAWGARETISFIDPLTFGHLNLTLGMMCLVAALFDLRRNKVGLNTVVKLAAFAVGVYLSLRSGSRTGWLALPVVLGIVLYQLYKPGLVKFVAMLLALFGAIWVFGYFNPALVGRFGVFSNEIISYPWAGGVAPDNSVAMRINFYRLGTYYFLESPWFGWGNRGYAAIKDAAPLLTFSSQYTRDFAFSALFHSDLTTQSVRYGVFGLASVLVVFGVPLRLFGRALRAGGGDQQKAACLGLTFMLCLLVSSLSTEVFDSKGMTTFTAVILAGLFAEILNRQTDPLEVRRSSAR